MNNVELNRNLGPMDPSYLSVFSRYISASRELMANAKFILKTDCYNEGFRDKIANENTVLVEYKQTHIDQALSLYPELTITRGDIRVLPFKDECFDLIVDLSTIDHVRPQDVPQVVREYNRLLETAGMILLVAWFSEFADTASDWNPDKQYYFRYAQTKAEFEKYFRIVRETPLLKRADPIDVPYDPKKDTDHDRGYCSLVEFLMEKKMIIETKDNTHYDPEIKNLLQDLDGPDYLTHTYSDIGIDSLIILRSVFRVDKSYLGNYLARFLHGNKSLYEGKTLLDLGCGCGLLGLICAHNGSTEVHFADINVMAVKNSKLNAMLMDIDKTKFSCGSLFTQVPPDRKFDVVIFNPPSISGIPANTSETALVREDKVISTFYELLPEHLAPGGIVIMPGSSRFDGKMSPLNMAKEFSYQSTIADTHQEDDGNFKYIVVIRP